MYLKQENRQHRLQEKGVTIPPAFSRQFVESEETAAPELIRENTGLQEQVRYYEQLNNISPNIRNLVFAANTYVSEKHAAEASRFLEAVAEDLRQVFGHLEKAISLLYGTGEDNAYTAFIRATFEMKENGMDHTPALEAASYIYSRLKDISSYIDLEYKHDTCIDFDYFEHMHSDRTAALSSVKQVKTNRAQYQSRGLGSQPSEELQNSAAKILEYAGIPEEKATCFMMNLTAFRNLKTSFPPTKPPGLSERQWQTSFLTYTPRFSKKLSKPGMIPG